MKVRLVSLLVLLLAAFVGLNILSAASQSIDECWCAPDFQCGSAWVACCVNEVQSACAWMMDNCGGFCRPAGCGFDCNWNGGMRPLPGETVINTPFGPVHRKDFKK